MAPLAAERQQVSRLLSSLRVFPVTERVAWRAAEFVRAHRRSHQGIGLGDYLIAATAEVEGHGFAIVDLPAIGQAATIMHRGPMNNVMSSIQTLARWMDANGYRSTGYNRELYIDYGRGGDPQAWVTELQEPITREGAAA